MNFNSIDFLIFFPIVAILYYVIPQKGKKYWLLLASYYFYMNWNPAYALLILASTVITYISGVVINKVGNSERTDVEKKKLKNLAVALSFISNIGILVYFKYTNFLIENINAIIGHFGGAVQVRPLDILLPVGISFYTFQALGYTMDVYRGTIEAEKNFFTYALFVSFFPQLVAGPIERSSNLLRQLREEHKFSFENLREGLMIMVWGFFMKLVVADRIATVVDTVFSDLESYEGATFLVVMFLFMIEIYCDFAGYSTIAVGAAKVMGFELMENFNCPYLGQSINEYWARWHISMTSWFRDYVYIPLGGNRKGKVRKWLNVLIVFTLSGFWHGAAWNYVAWGVVSAIIQMMGAGMMPIRTKLCEVFGLDRNTFSHKLYRIVGTDLIIMFTLVIFRSKTLVDAGYILQSFFTTWNPWVLLDGSLYQLGLSQKQFGAMMLSVAVLIVADVMKYNGKAPREWLMKQETWFRWLMLILGILAIALFGFWGYGYDASAFIYFQF